MRAVFLSTFLLAAGCAGSDQYLFHPVMTNSGIGNQPAEAYSVPVLEPRGQVRVASLGETIIRPWSGAQAEDAMTVRVVLDNASDPAPWVLDTRRVVLKVDGEPSSYVAEEQPYAGHHVVVARRGEERVVDLYFPLPPTSSVGEAVDGFDVTWQVRTGSGVVTRRTRFERRATEEDWAAPDTFGGWYE